MIRVAPVVASAVSCTTHVLLTPEEIDEAAKVKANDTPPGS